ncbi:LysR family transcriptional regulator [Rhodoplanes sp. TEM]|uniref:LysR family transcriptional regulator n=1 Tax=Rhodoplanes tepidamans TaxID=200616 RepID=A0ABT5J3X1_RHOTP|nr:MULTISPECIES: LysR family transcriptional regulator [Rhodoplanes]MDC7784350.1 LysR family transcriptional regulator [Rhodoplanes tepidamans]MDC7983386.1 LysR family transcriptional regulator [Rhodoplanes sp. TEM]MDQ0354522.1 DNA-binding transcriptional LysR family regulator [Rhodoplanes tepidamans]
MDIRLLREFLVLSECLNFSRAAERLAMTQPVLSRHVKFLEDHFGAQLLNRSTHRVEMTEVGRVFAQEAAKIVGQFEQSVAVIRACPGVGRHSLSIGFLGEATRPFLATFLGRYSERHPKVAIECVDGDLDLIVGRLEKNTCDLGFIIRPQDGLRIDHLSHLTLFSDPLCAVLNRNHPLAARDGVALADVARWPIIGIARHVSPLAHECNQLFFARHEVEYRIAKECPNLESCCFTVEFNEQAIVLLPRHRGFLTGVNSVLKPVTDAGCSFDIDLVWDAANPNPCIRGFLDDFTAFCRNRDWEADLARRFEPAVATPMTAGPVGHDRVSACAVSPG